MREKCKWKKNTIGYGSFMNWWIGCAGPSCDVYYKEKLPERCPICGKEIEEERDEE